MSGRVKLVKVEFLINEALLKDFDSQYPEHRYNDRSDAIRTLIRNQVTTWQGGKTNGE